MSALRKFLDILGPDDVVRALQKAREIIPPTHDRVMWHGSGSGDLRGGQSGLHLGTHEAARQALEARIGVPAEGDWYGTRPYGETMLMGRERIPLRSDGYPFVSGYNVRAPEQDYLASQRGMPHVSRDVLMDPSWMPSIAPYRITGEMKNTPKSPMDDYKANGVMQGLLKRGQARRGFYYGNIAEDAGSVSAVVPGPQHVEPIDLEQLLRTGKYAAGGSAKNSLVDLARRVMKGYPLAPRGEWWGDANFEQTGGRMVHMHPDEFLAQARPMALDDVARENIDDLKQHMQSGRTLDPLSFYVSGKEDGRHRAHAAKELGIESVPVLDFRPPRADGGRKLLDLAIKAYHSSPHKFDRFDLSKIGTGEGAQMYGHGLYFAENPDVSGQGGHYWNMFYNRMKESPEQRAATAMMYGKFDPSAAIDLLRSQKANYLSDTKAGWAADQPEILQGLRALARKSENSAKYLEKHGRAGPYTYEVQINEHPERFVDWMNPLRDQSPHVQSALAYRAEQMANEANAARRAMLSRGMDFRGRAYSPERMEELSRVVDPGDITGQSLYGGTQRALGAIRSGEKDAEASREMLGRGVAGIRYPDALSREAGGGFNNYVTFDDKPIEILRRYARGGSLIQDRHPTRYLPGVGRQVMADGGAATNMADLMADVNSVFSRSRPAATRESLTGVSSSPYISGPGAYTDAGGQQIAPAFVTGLKDGYPVPPSATSATEEPTSFADAQRLTLRRMGLPGFEKGGRTGFAAGGGGWRQYADLVNAALDAAKNVSPRQRIGVYHNLNARYINDLVNDFKGIPGPSLAISKPTANPIDFGNATLIGRPHLAIPGDENHVFGSDAYTPRMPRIFRASEFTSSDKPANDFIFKGPNDTTEVPATVKNVLAHMRQSPVIGGEGEFPGLGLLKAHIAPRPTSLRDIQARRGVLPEYHDEEDRFWGGAINDLITKGGLFKQYLREGSNYPHDQMVRGAIDYHNEGLPGLYKTYREDLPPAGVSTIRNMIHDVGKLNPSYMEAKPMRNVGFDEFAGAVLPNEGSGYVAHGALARAGVPEDKLHFYRTPQERYSILRDVFAPEHGFKRGGGVEAAMDIVRNAQPHSQQMLPSTEDMEAYRDIMRHSHVSGGPGVAEMRDASYPLPFGSSIPLGRWPKDTVDTIEKLSPVVGMGMQVAANAHPATRLASRALDAAQRVKFAGDVYKKGYGDPSDFFSMLGGGKSDALGMAAAFYPNPNEHEATRSVFDRMRASGAPVEEPSFRDGYENGGVKRAAADIIKDMVEGAADTAPARTYGRSTVAHPYRKAFPGIYGNPREIAEEAESRVAPESPAMKLLFGVDRQDLYDIGKGRKGNVEPDIAMKAGARGTPSAENLMVPRNERRLINVLEEAGKKPGLRLGMDPWYVMDPLFQHMERLFGRDEAIRRFNDLNHSTGTMSPGSPVNTEINRGLAAYYLHNQGRYKDFLDYGGNPPEATQIPRGRNMSFAEEFPDLLGHAYHSTSQAPILQKYFETGRHGMQSPKVPLYIQSSGVPETGFQTKLPVPDAHFTRAIGMADTRRGENDYGVSMKMSEYQPVGPWFSSKVAAPVGLEGVPAQARLWGVMSGQTGVDTEIGSPKLEMLSNEIMRIANRERMDPFSARDLILEGKLRNRGGSVERALSVVSRKRDAA